MLNEIFNPQVYFLLDITLVDDWMKNRPARYCARFYCNQFNPGIPRRSFTNWVKKIVRSFSRPV